MIAGTLQDSVNIRYVFTISGTPTTVNGADDNSRTLAYTAGQADVYLNGVKQVVGTDVTATSGSSVVFASALAANDIVEVVAFDTFQAANVDAGAVASGTLSNDRLPTGSILQVLSTTKTDTFTTTSGSKVDITGLSVAITPSSSSNKVLITGRVNIGLDRTAPYLYPIFLLRDSTEICIHDSASNRTRATTGGQWGASANDPTFDYAINFLDSPSSTSELTYKLQIFSESGGTAYVNRGKENDGDAAITGRFTSVITVQEVAG